MVSISWPEAIFWCTLSWLTLAARLVSRRMRLGAWRNLQLEDAIAFVVVLLATGTMVLLDKVMEYYAIESDDVVFTPDFVRRRRIGAKLMLSSEHTQLLTIWLNKAAMLLMYYRLTQLTNQRKQVIYTSIFCGCAFVSEN
jgi:hypothetical protein